MDERKKLSPLRAIRNYCLWCCSWQSKEVELCPSIKCPLYDLRFGKNPTGQKVLQQLRQRCLICSDVSNVGADEIKNCDCNQPNPFTQKIDETKTKQKRDYENANHCFLYPYRIGKNPNRKGLGRKGGNPNIRNINSRLIRGQEMGFNSQGGIKV